MEIIIGKNTGFCSGVKKAISGTEKLLDIYGKVYCHGEIIHNPSVVNRLKKKGMIVISDLSEIPDGSNFIVRSHGLPNDLINRAKEKALKIFDFTCPKVKRIHKLVNNINENSHTTIIIGNPAHPEVKAIASLIKKSSFIIERKEDLKDISALEEVYVLVQSTFNPDIFSDIVKGIISISKKSVIYNTLCRETIKRQKEAKYLSKKVDLVVIIGGKNSSNTKTLYTLIRENTKAIHIEGDDELKYEWFKGIERVAILSGASTPKDDVNTIYNQIANFSKTNH